MLEDNALDYAAVEALLQEETDRYDVLHFCLMGLDADYSRTTRSDALAYCAELCLKPPLLTHLMGILYSTAPPSVADFTTAIEISRGAGLEEVAALLQDVWEKRQAIADAAVAWDRFTHDQLPNAQVKDELRSELMRNGYFRGLVGVLAGGAPQFDSLVLRHFQIENRIPKVSVPLILQAFHDFLRSSLGISVAETMATVLEDDRDEDFEEAQDETIEGQIRTCLERYRKEGQGKPSVGRPISPDDVKERVDTMIAKIEALLSRNDPERARQGFLGLIQYQVKFSFPNNILMSCTNLINIARKQRKDDFVQFVLAATEVLGIEDAAFLCTKAEILRSLGRLPEALKAYEEVVDRFPEYVVARNGRAETLRSLGRLPEALKAYEEVVDRFPENVVARTGRAETLRSLGLLPEALKAYEEVVDRFPGDVVARNGRDSILLLQGKLSSPMIF
ncbi:MAG: hypothetical protein RLZZ165_1223, partial [Bacteroidota bacterium]